MGAASRWALSGVWQYSTSKLCCSACKQSTASTAAEKPAYSLHIALKWPLYHRIPPLVYGVCTAEGNNWHLDMYSMDLTTALTSAGMQSKDCMCMQG